MRKVILAILLTSLFWTVVYLLVSHRAETSDKPIDIPDYSEVIIGCWEPIELADTKLTFSKYGTMRIGDTALDINYSVNENIVKVSLFGLLDTSFEIKIYNEDKDTYLEIFDAPQFAGKYKKVDAETVEVEQKVEETMPVTEQATDKKSQQEARRRQPRVVNREETGASVAVEECEPPKPDTEVEQPATVQSSKVEEQTPAQTDTHTDKPSITGVWSPVEGAEYSLTITKYGTVIQHINSAVNMRYQYNLSGSNLKIGYDRNAKANVYAENGKTYLEIYNSEKFSGKYRLTSKAVTIGGDRVNASDYQTVIVGKWKPVFGAEYPLEISKYGTVIQNINSAVNMRYDYSLDQDCLKIGYDRNARVSIVKNTTGTYLEIYNSEKFSGLYKKQ